MLPCVAALHLLGAIFLADELVLDVIGSQSSNHTRPENLRTCILALGVHGQNLAQLVCPVVAGCFHDVRPLDWFSFVVEFVFDRAPHTYNRRDTIERAVSHFRSLIAPSFAPFVSL